MGFSAKRGRLWQFTVDFGEPQLLTPGQNRVAQIFPEDGQKIPFCTVSLAIVDNRKTDTQHIVSTTGQPLDLLHIGCRDADHWLVAERKAFGQQFFKLFWIGQKTDRYARCFGILFALECASVWALPRAHARAKVCGHHVHLVRVKFVRHDILLLVCVLEA